MMNVKIEPDVSFGVHVVADEAYLTFSFVQFLWARPVLRRVDPFCYDIRGASIAQKK